MSNNVAKKLDSSKAFWSQSVTDYFEQLSSSSQGLGQEQVELRLKRYGPNRLNNKNGTSNVSLFFAQFKNSIF